MAVRFNSDKETVKRIKEGLKAKGGYCPLPNSKDRRKQMHLQGVQRTNCRPEF